MQIMHVEVMYSSIQSDLQSILGVRNNPRRAFPDFDLFLFSPTCKVPRFPLLDPLAELVK